MRTIVSLLAAQSGAAELVLIKLLAGFESPRFLQSAALGERRPMDIRCANPDTAPAGPRGANVVIHFPARPERISLVRGADRFDHLTTHDVTEISETIKRLERAHFLPESLLCLRNRKRHVVFTRSGAREYALLVPAVVGRGTCESILTIVIESPQQMFQPTSANSGSAFEQHDYFRLRICREPIETGCRADAVATGNYRGINPRQELSGSRVRIIGNHDDFNSRTRRLLQTVERHAHTLRL